MTKELSVIIPAYNEEEQLASTVDSVVEYLTSKDYRFEVILVNDGSTDKTKEKTLDLLARHPFVKLIQFDTNRGKGHAVKAGIAQARYARCLFMDADNATSIREWDKFEPHFKRGSKVVIASRWLPDSRIVHPQPILRRLLGNIYRVSCQTLFGLKTSDFNCGFKAYETPLAKKIYSAVQLEGWAFDTEVFCLLKKEHVVAAEVPVSWEHREKRSHLAPIRAGFGTIGSLWRLKRIYG